MAVARSGSMFCCPRSFQVSFLARRLRPLALEDFPVGGRCLEEAEDFFVAGGGPAQAWAASTSRIEIVIKALLTGRRKNPHLVGPAAPLPRHTKLYHGHAGFDAWHRPGCFPCSTRMRLQSRAKLFETKR